MITPVVVAILPMFNPENDVVERIRRLKVQTDMVVVVDDGSACDMRRDELISTIESVILLHQNNSGIAAALNSGIRCAIERLPTVNFIVTVDQDSSLGPEYVERALRCFARAARENIRVGIVAAEQFNDWTLAPEGTIGSFRDVIEVAQSGMVIDANSFSEFGFFDESLFIDCVDTEYVLRLRSYGVLTVLGEKCWLKHEAGVLITPTICGHQVRSLGRVLKFSSHTSVRRYYITRNRILLYAHYAPLHPRWAMRQVAKETRTLILSAIFGPAKLKQLLAVILGARDAILGRRGLVKEDALARLTDTR